MNSRNNINGIGRVERNEVYGGQDRRLLDTQRAVVRKLVTALNRFDNVYFEVCNEPYERDGLTQEWNHLMIEAVVAAEAALPNKHLIAQGFPNSSAAVSRLNRHVSILNFHGTTPDAVRLNYAIYLKGGVQAELTLALPLGRYKVDWLNTKTGRVEKSESFRHGGGNRMIVSPTYSDDIALRVMLEPKN